MNPKRQIKCKKKKKEKEKETYVRDVDEKLNALLLPLSWALGNSIKEKWNVSRHAKPCRFVYQIIPLPKIFSAWKISQKAEVMKWVNGNLYLRINEIAWKKKWKKIDRNLLSDYTKAGNISWNSPNCRVHSFLKFHFEK